MADGYTPKTRMRVSIIGLIRNSAEELEAVFKRNEEARKTHEDEECECDACSQTDWTGFHAAGLQELVEHLGQLDKDPNLLFEFCDLYALHGVAAAHLPPDTTPVSQDQETPQS